jgi:hypothetical protein
VHDVEPSGAEAEVERLHVDDDLIADLRAAHKPGIGDRRALRAADARPVAVISANGALATLAGVEKLDHEALLAGRRRIGFENDGAAKLQHHRPVSCVIKLSREGMRVSRLRGALDVTVLRCLLDAHIHITLTIRPVGQLVRAIDQLGRDRPRVTLLDTLKHRLNPQTDA